jgi:hypothetical protein
VADDLKPKSHLALIGTIGTALISAYVAVTIAKVNAKTEIEKAGLDHKAVVERLTKLEEHAQQDSKDKAKMMGYLEQQNSLLQVVFASQAGIKSVMIPPPAIKSYAGTQGRGRPPERTLVPKKETIPPPKQAATRAVTQLKTLRAELNVPP